MINKKAEYYTCCRWDILKIIPENVDKLLSIGCGAGFTEKEMEKSGIKVTGVEINKNVVKKARENMSEVFIGDIENIKFNLKKKV